MNTFYFVAGEQVITKHASTLLDAWLSLEIGAKTRPIACDFRELPISAYDVNGTKLATRTWDGWHKELLRDTYGDNYQAVLNNATELT